MILLTASVVKSLPYAAILIALATFIAGQREFRRRAKVDYVSDLEKRIADLEADNKSLDERIEDCERDRRELRVENFKLMRRVVTLEEKPQ